MIRWGINLTEARIKRPGHFLDREERLKNEEKMFIETIGVQSLFVGNKPSYFKEMLKTEAYKDILNSHWEEMNKFTLKDIISSMAS